MPKKGANSYVYHAKNGGSKHLIHSACAKGWFQQLTKSDIRCPVCRDKTINIDSLYSRIEKVLAKAKVFSKHMYVGTVLGSTQGTYLLIGKILLDTAMRHEFIGLGGAAVALLTSMGATVLYSSLTYPAITGTNPLAIWTNLLASGALVIYEGSNPANIPSFGAIFSTAIKTSFFGGLVGGIISVFNSNTVP